MATEGNLLGPGPLEVGAPRGVRLFGVDGAPSPTSTFGYGAAGQLINATVPGQTLAYTFEASNACGTPALAGKNTNRVAMCVNAAATTNTYDGADRLTGSSDAAVGVPVYDAHGNTTTLGSQTLTYDSSDRHLTTTVGTTAVTCP